MAPRSGVPATTMARPRPISSKPSALRIGRARSTVLVFTRRTAARSLAWGIRSPGPASPSAIARRISAATCSWRYVGSARSTAPRVRFVSSYSGGLTALITPRIVASMPIIHLRGSRGGTDTADRPMAGAPGTPVEVLFREAKRRERRRRAAALGVLLALGGLAYGLLAAAGGSSPPPAGRGGGAGTDPGAPGTAAGHFTFRGNGIGDARFGQPEAVAIAELDQVLGSA